METKPTTPSAETAPSYDLEAIYRKVCTHQTQVCREYLAQRGIGNECIDDLIENGILVHNLYKGNSYCCFAVFDQKGVLCCLDNHQIGGERKFVLGKKVPFSRDWAVLPQAERLFICEGIIDYLSMKTLHDGTIPGIALLGNRISVDPDLFTQARVIIAAFDSDRGGVSALLDMQERFPDKDYMVCDLGDCKDPNEYLQAVKAGHEPAKLTAQDKLTLYREYLQAENKSAVADTWGINRSYLYQIVRESEELILNGFSQRHAGRKPEGSPATLTEASERIAVLEEEKRHQAREKERYYARSEFLKIRLKWAEKERQGTAGDPPKRQIKKKKRNRS
jgi:DNA primase